MIIFVRKCVNRLYLFFAKLKEKKDKRVVCRFCGRIEPYIGCELMCQCEIKKAGK